MIINSIEMENFKSYEKKHFINIRKGFTVIIGPTGSGKSNIGNAILFVLGIKLNKIFGVDKLSDFIYRSDNMKERGYVTLNIISDDNTKFSLKREIVFSNGEYKSIYYINDKKSKHDEVAKLIDSFHICLDAYSFVSHEDIHNILKMSGVEKRQLFESMADIESYKEKIEKLKLDIYCLNKNISKYEKFTEDRNKYDALINEKNSLIELQNKIIEDERKAFLDLFDSINDQFHRIYSRLSGNSEANLEITDRNDPLNSEVYIKVRSEDEFMVKIDALGGSEKSLAILALILSFQVKNPSPLYYLDEVDTFLDRSNAEHVGEFLKENSEKSQIVMVSLKRSILKLADNIIVVTEDIEN